MEWEKKIEMCNLGQEDDLMPFKKYVAQHIDSFDVQAWDMFLTVFSVSIENIQKHSQFLQEILHKLELFDNKYGDSLSMRTNIRLGILIERIKEL